MRIETFCYEKTEKREKKKRKILKRKKKSDSKEKKKKVCNKIENLWISFFFRSVR